MNRSHISIPALLKIESGVLSHIGVFLKHSGFDKVVILFGNGLTSMFGDKVFTSLTENEVDVLYSQEMDTVDFNDITDLAFSLPKDTEAIIGMGGGKVVDAAKYIGFILKIPFISVPTSSSSDGFSSSSASLLVNGRRKSVPAKMPYGILVDIDVIKSAPRRFLMSGIGDMISKISSCYDWQHEEDLGFADVNDCAYMMAKKAVNSFVRTPFDDIESELLLKELLDSLAMSGIANEIAGSSLPTSGSEHMISHALDSFLERPQLHGVQVGIATYIMCKIENHRYERVNTIFTKTGFWDYCETLDLKRSDFERAIDLAPTMKPGRHTYIQEEAYRVKAKELLVTDEHLTRILK
ncbi:MAG: iron-containing alcohol dehydrogenase family protein [Saccharofermentans sp.]|nr:iron-containing alcohol dehydrogenase family protein [Saccharofermentans sp.]